MNSVKMFPTSTHQPLNGQYMRSSDFPEWGNDFAEYYNTTKKALGCKVPHDNGLLVQNITFVVTERCNLNCTYCYESHDFHKNGSKMTKEIGKKAIDFIFQKEKINNYFDADQKRGVILDFIGGEPLLEIELIDYMVDYFKIKAFELDHQWSTNYMISISTNGILYDTPKVQKFLDKNNNKVSISITIDGNKELHDACRLFPNGKGSYDIVESNVKKWIANRGGNRTKLTIAPGNIDHLDDAIFNLWDMGMQCVYANTVYEKGWGLDHAKIFYQKLKIIADRLLQDGNYRHFYTSLFDESIGSELGSDRNYCGGNGEMLAIGPDGRCYPCLRYMSHSMSSNRKPFVCGSIDNGLLDRDEDPDLINLCSITMSSQSDERCNNCKIASGCGVCSAYNYDVFGDPNVRATYICVMHQARVLASAYYWNTLYKLLNVDKQFELNIPREWALEIVSKEEYDNLVKLSK